MAKPSGELSNYIYELRELIYNGKRVGRFKQHLGKEILSNPKLLAEYSGDLKFYERQYGAQLEPFNYKAPKASKDFSSTVGWGKSAEEELHKRGLYAYAWERNTTILPPSDTIQYPKSFHNPSLSSKQLRQQYEQQRIDEIKHATEPDMRGFFPAYDKTGKHGKVVTGFDTEFTDAKTPIEVAGLQLVWNDTAKRFENVPYKNSTFYRTYAPGVIDKESTESFNVHGITDKIAQVLYERNQKQYGVKYSHKWDEAQRKGFFKDFVGDTVLFGQNILGADLPVLTGKLPEHFGSDAFTKPYLDTMHLFQGLFGIGEGKAKLQNVASRLGISAASLGIPAHAAYADTVLLFKAVEKLIQEHPHNELVQEFRYALMHGGVQTHRKSPANDVLGYGSLVHKPGGRRMTDAELRELMGAEMLSNDVVLDYDLDGNNTGFGLAEDELKELKELRLGMNTPLGSNQSYAGSYASVMRAIKAAIQAGANRDSIISAAEAANKGLSRSAISGMYQLAMLGVTPEKTVLSPKERYYAAQHERRLLRYTGRHTGLLNRLAASKARRESHIQSDIESIAATLSEEPEVFSRKDAAKRLKAQQSIADAEMNAFAATLSKEPEVFSRKDALNDIELASFANILSKRGISDEQAYSNLKEFSKQRETNKALLKANWNNLSHIDYRWLEQQIDDRPIEEFAQILEHTIKPAKEAGKAFQEMTKHIEAVASKAPKAYDWFQIYEAYQAGVGEVGGAIVDIMPGFAKPAAKRMNSALSETMGAMKAIQQNRWNNITSVASMAGAGIGTVLGGHVGATIGGAAARLASNLVGGTIQAHTTAKFDMLAAKIHMIGAVFSALTAPLQLFKVGLGNVVNMFNKLGGVWARQYGNPLTELTGLQMPNYSRSLAADTLMGVQQGTINNMINSFAYGSAGLYTSGRFDINRLVSAARAGVFSTVYAPMGGSAEENMALTANKLYEQMYAPGVSERRKQELMFYANDIDPNLPNMLTRMHRLGIADARSLTDGSLFAKGSAHYVYATDMDDKDWHDWTWTSAEFGRGMQAFGYATKRIATPLWEQMGKPALNVLNRTLDSFAASYNPANGLSGVIDGLKRAFNEFKKAMKEEFNFDFSVKSIKEKFSGWWQQLLDSGIQGALKTGWDWLLSKKDDLVKMIEPVLRRISDFLDDIQIETNWLGLPVSVSTKSGKAAESIKEWDSTHYKMLDFTHAWGDLNRDAQWQSKGAISLLANSDVAAGYFAALDANKINTLTHPLTAIKALKESGVPLQYIGLNKDLVQDDQFVAGLMGIIGSAFTFAQEGEKFVINIVNEMDSDGKFTGNRVFPGADTKAQVSKQASGNSATYTIDR